VVAVASASLVLQRLMPTHRPHSPVPEDIRETTTDPSRETLLRALEPDADDVNVHGVDVLEGMPWQGVDLDRRAKLR
jgi:hypothetical protein